MKVCQVVSCCDACGDPEHLVYTYAYFWTRGWASRQGTCRETVRREPGDTLLETRLAPEFVRRKLLSPGSVGRVGSVLGGRTHKASERELSCRCRRRMPNRHTPEASVGGPQSASGSLPDVPKPESSHASGRTFRENLIFLGSVCRPSRFTRPVTARSASRSGGYCPGWSSLITCSFEPESKR